MERKIVIETERVILVTPEIDDAELILNYHLENKEHLSTWEPKRPDEFFTIENWQKLLSENNSLFESGSAIKFIALSKNQSEIIGICSFTNIVRGVFQACNLGYSISKKYEGQGYMTEILGAAMKYIFENVSLHRIMANYIPDNFRSTALLKRLGFEKEGLARSYLKINGKWQDHILTAKLNPESSA